MKIIFSPTKTMEYSCILGNTKPIFFARAQEILEDLKGLDDLSLNRVWKVSDKLFKEAKLELEGSDFNHTSMALYSYNGISFKYLDPLSLDAKGLEYLNRHLRILSGLYGGLRPSDSIINYRLEMNYAKKLWQDTISKEFTEEDNIINLASKEYSQMLTNYAIPVIDIVFYKNKNGKLKEEATESKMMRGRFLRYLALNQIEDLSLLKTIELDSYKYNSGLSNSKKIVFVKNA